MVTNGYLCKDQVQGHIDPLLSITAATRIDVLCQEPETPVWCNICVEEATGTKQNAIPVTQMLHDVIHLSAMTDNLRITPSLCFNFMFCYITLDTPPRPTLSASQLHFPWTDFFLHLCYFCEVEGVGKTGWGWGGVGWGWGVNDTAQ